MTRVVKKRTFAKNQRKIIMKILVWSRFRVFCGGFYSRRISIYIYTIYYRGALVIAVCTVYPVTGIILI